jgi:signal transduction histidine kinase
VKSIKSGADNFIHPSNLDNLNKYFADVSEEKEHVLPFCDFASQSLLDRIACLYFVKSALTKKYVYANPKCLNFVNKSEDEILGKNYTDFISPKYLEKINELDDAAISKRSVAISPALYLEFKDGTSGVLNVAKYPIFGNNGAPEYVVTVADVIEDNNLNSANDHRNNIEFMKNRFVSIISHEFRTPLTSIMLASDLLRYYGKSWDEAERNKHFDRIKNTVLSMTKMLENILNISKMESGNFELHMETVDLGAFLGALAENAQFASSSNKKVNFIFNGTNSEAVLDENLVSLIVANLLSNALKYSSDNSEVELYAKNSDSVLELKIVDHGIGIPDTEIAHLFELFHRASNVGSVAGYGLGLTLVKQCVDLHSGRIEVISSVGEGSIFTVYLPIGNEKSHS